MLAPGNWSVGALPREAAPRCTAVSDCLSLFARFRPLATRGAIDLADPFMGDFATYAGEDGASFVSSA